MIARYIDGREKMGDGPFDPEAFRRDFDFQSIQRNLKAAGRFVFFDVVKGNPNFLADIPRTLGYAKKKLLAASLEDIETKNIENVQILINGDTPKQGSYGKYYTTTRKGINFNWAGKNKNMKGSNNKMKDTA